MKNLSGKWYWILLAFAFITFLFLSGCYNIGFFAFLCPLFLMLVSRNVGKVWQYILFALVLIIAAVAKFPEMFDLGFPLNQTVTVIYMLVLIAALILDRFIYNGFTRNGSVARKFVGTFIFPTIFAALEFTYNLLGMGNLFAISTTQINNISFIQSASIIGQYGLAFLICWLPSFVYFLIDAYNESKDKNAAEVFAKIKKPLAIFLAVYIAAFAFGSLRIFLTDFSKDQVKVAYANAYEQRRDAEGEWIVEDQQVLRGALASELKMASDSGAKLISFNEEAFYMYEDQKEGFLEFAKQQVKANNLYASIGIETEDREGKELSDNAVVMISPEGKILYHYSKSILIPYMETEYYKAGDYQVPILPLELAPGVTSNVSTAICFEGESTMFLEQLGTDTDIHLNPSFEWKDSEILHSASIQLRAIEYGTSVIEPTTVNKSSIYDYFGQNVAASCTDKSGYSDITTGYVPAKGITTIYATCGYWLNYLYIPGLIAFAILGLIRYRKTK